MLPAAGVEPELEPEAGDPSGEFSDSEEGVDELPMLPAAGVEPEDEPDSGEAGEPAPSAPPPTI